MFDLAIVGGGPGGYHAALLAAERGLNVALIEKHTLGGVCLNEGCIPSKTLLNSAKYAHDYSAFALADGVKKIDFEALQARKNKVVQTLVGSLNTAMKKEGVTLFSGEGRFAPKEGDSFVLLVGDEKIVASKAIVATGSSPVVPPIPGIDLPHVMRSTEILSLTKAPSSLVVIGGGVIGLEMAQVFAAAECAVTIVEMADQLAGSLDKDIEKVLASALKKEGIATLMQSRVTAITPNAVTVEGPKGVQEIAAEAVLVSVGRKPNVTNLGLEALGLIATGAIVVDEFCATAVPGLYALGDVNGKWLLAHTAYREAEMVVAHLFGESVPLNYDTIPSVIYTKPEVASVGLTEQQAQEAGITFVVGARPFGSNGRFLAETDRERSLCKVLVEPATGKTIGVHLVGLYASEIIASASLIVQLGITQEQLAHTTLPHPTVSEVLKETILSIKG